MSDALYEAQKLSHDAHLLLENSAFQKALSRLSEMYISEWRLSSPTDIDTRESIFFRMRALDELRADLSAILTGGHITAHNHRLKKAGNRGI
jgi:hypothetical protein